MNASSTDPKVCEIDQLSLLPTVIVCPVRTGLFPLPPSLLLHGPVSAPSSTSSGYNCSQRPAQTLPFTLPLQ